MCVVPGIVLRRCCGVLQTVLVVDVWWCARARVRVCARGGAVCVCVLPCVRTCCCACVRARCRAQHAPDALRCAVGCVDGLWVAARACARPCVRAGGVVCVRASVCACPLPRAACPCVAACCMRARVCAYLPHLTPCCRSLNAAALELDWHHGQRQKCRADGRRRMLLSGLYVL